MSSFTGFDSLRAKFANERLPLIATENPWSDESSLTSQKFGKNGGNGGRGRACLRILLHLAIACTLALVGASLWLTGLWPHQYARLTAAERVLRHSPLIGEF